MATISEAVMTYYLENKEVEASLFSRLNATPQGEGGYRYEILPERPPRLSCFSCCFSCCRASTSLQGRDAAQLLEKDLQRKDFVRDRWKHAVSKVLLLTRGMAEMRAFDIEGKMLSESHWLEALASSHPGPLLRSFLVQKWERGSSSESFADWLIGADGQRTLADSRERFAGYLAYASEEVTVHPETKIPIHYADLDKLQVKYLSKEERVAYQVNFKSGRDGEICFSQNNHPFCTKEHVSHGSKGKAIFVVDANGQLYSGTQVYNRFHHSSFLSGGAVMGAGELLTDDEGHLIEISNNSGHYQPGPKEMVNILKLFDSNGVDLSRVTLKLVIHPYEGKYQTYNAVEFLKTHS